MTQRCRRTARDNSPPRHRSRARWRACERQPCQALGVDRPRLDGVDRQDLVAVVGHRQRLVCERQLPATRWQTGDAAILERAAYAA